MMNVDTRCLYRMLVSVAQEAAIVANVCDHIEHNEDADINDVRLSAGRLRAGGVELAARLELDPAQLYRDRLVAVERRNVLFDPDVFDAAVAVPIDPTWAQLQRVQIAHDRAYHPDVIGMPKLEQMRHYALHVAKLAGAIASTIDGAVALEDLAHRRLPDCLIFGVKLSTVTAERLPEKRISDAHSGDPLSGALLVRTPS
jgi:hypothetical protein